MNIDDIDGLTYIIVRTTVDIFDNDKDEYMTSFSLENAVSQYEKWIDDEETSICTICIVYKSTDYDTHPLIDQATKIGAVMQQLRESNNPPVIKLTS